MHIPHMAVSMTTSNATNSYTLHMQTSSEHLSMAIRDIIDHFDWGYDHNKLLFVYEKHKKNGFLNNLYIKWWKERNLPERCDDSDVDHRKKSFTNELDLKNIGGVFVMLIIGLSFSFIVTSLEFYFKAKRRRLLDGKSTTIKERLKRDLHFALCTNCTSSRPTFIHEKDSIDKIENNNDEIFEDLNIKSNCIQNNPQETITSIDHERLTIVPLNHSPCHRIT
ncbi:unnamed protein product [Rotaria sp. Silwood1]|nr:unnamed protein product [Rotaria sp. Silwood1]